MTRFASWELEPRPCPECGSARWVMWSDRPVSLSRDPSGRDRVTATTARGLWCRACTPDLSRVCNIAVAVNLTGEVFVWQHPNATLDYGAASTLGWWLSNLIELQPHRAIERRRPGSWRIELHDDGRLWMPWDPGSDDKHGEPWPLREGTLRASRRARRCLCCRGGLHEGDTVHRADLGHRPRERRFGGWTKTALTRAMVCRACAREVALTRAAAQPGRRVVKHLVAIDGG